MVEHSDLLLAPFRIGEPLAGGRGYTLNECCITKILSKRVFFRNKNRPPAAGNRVHASTASRGAYDPGTNRRQASGATRWQKKPTGQEPRAARCGRIGQARRRPCRLLQPALRLRFGGHLRRRAAQPYVPIAFRRPIPYLPRRKRNAGRMECAKCGLSSKKYVVYSSSCPA